MSNTELMYGLYKAKTDEEVTRILESVSGIEWKEYGGNENNTTIINGQMDDPIRCLVENIVNGIDASKMLMARLDGVDLNNPLDPKMPKTNNEAKERYFGITKPLAEYKSGEREKLSTVGIYIERLKATDSSIIIYDRGEGQRPADFERTLLSLVKGNKASLPFVQGKYNMGSTGVLKKCNGHRYELVIAMRNLLLTDADGRIGFTIIRYADAPKKGKKYRTYEYLTIDGKIPYVDYEITMKDSFQGVANFSGGCIRKLYSYNIGRTGGSARIPWKFNSLFYDTEIPIRTMIPNSETDPTLRNGWIIGTKNKILEENSDIKVLLNKRAELVLSCGKANIKFFVFSNVEKNGNSAETIFINGHNVSFIDNGQNNGDLPRTFLSNDCGLTQIAKNMMVFIDTTALPTSEMTDVYKPSRDRIDMEAPLSKEIVGCLHDLLSEDEDLLRLNEEFKGKSLYNADAEKMAQEAMKSLSENKNIRKLLLSESGDILKKMAGISKRREKSHYEAETGYTKRRDKVIVSLRRDEAKESTIAYGKAGTIELELGSSTEEKDIDSIDDIIVSINPVAVKEAKPKTKGKGKEERVIKNAYTKAVENGRIKVLINPKTMGYYEEEKFNVSFENLKDESFNAVAEITVVKAEGKKRTGKEEYDKLSGPKLCFMSKAGSDDGIVAWKDVCAEVCEEDVCKIIVNNTSIEKIYINLDSSLYHKRLDKGLDKDRAKGAYISSVYVQSIIYYLSQAGNFAKIFEENAGMNEYRDIITDQLVLGTEMAIRNSLDFDMEK